MELGETACVPVTADPIKAHAILMLKSVTFSANHPVEKDTTGNFAAPEWLRGRTSQWPVCYTRGKSMNITATFDVLLGPTSGEDVSIRARMDLGGGAVLEWNGSVHVGVDQTEVTTSEMPSSGPLPNQVACFDPAGIEFFASPPGEPFGSAGTSSNGLYVVLGDPSGTPPFWTLLDISCRAAVSDGCDSIPEGLRVGTARCRAQVPPLAGAEQRRLRASPAQHSVAVRDVFTARLPDQRCGATTDGLRQSGAERPSHISGRGPSPPTVRCGIQARIDRWPCWTSARFKMGRGELEVDAGEEAREHAPRVAPAGESGDRRARKA